MLTPDFGVSPQMLSGLQLAAELVDRQILVPGTPRPRLQLSASRGQSWWRDFPPEPLLSSHRGRSFSGPIPTLTYHLSPWTGIQELNRSTSCEEGHCPLLVQRQTKFGSRPVPHRSYLGVDGALLEETLNNTQGFLVPGKQADKVFVVDHLRVGVRGCREHFLDLLAGHGLPHAGEKVAEHIDMN